MTLEAIWLFQNFLQLSLQSNLQPNLQSKEIMKVKCVRFLLQKRMDLANNRDEFLPFEWQNCFKPSKLSKICVILSYGKSTGNPQAS